MNYLSRKTYSILIIMFMLLSLLTISWCGKGQKSDKKQSPAKVENQVKETALTTITLSEKAEQRLGIETALVASRNMPGSMELGGEVIAPPGTEVKVSAPAAGTIVQNKAVSAGAKVKRGQEIMRLLLMPPEKDLMGAREEVTVKQVEYDVAQSKMERAEQLLKDRAISEKAHQEAQAALASASAALKAAKAKLSVLSGNSLDAAASDLSTLVLEAPIDGVLQQLYVAPGQTVPATTALFEVVSQNPVWVRVPIYAGDMSKIDLEKTAVVQSLGIKNQQIKTEAKSIQGPRLSNAISASSDLYYQMNNDEGLFRIGERVRVNLILKSESNSLVVPWSAIMYDIYGGTWIYVKVSPQIYSRRRVEVSRILDNFAVLTRGVNVGEEVVTTAAAELYGTEFGGGK